MLCCYAGVPAHELHLRHQGHLQGDATHSSHPVRTLNIEVQQQYSCRCSTAMLRSVATALLRLLAVHRVGCELFHRLFTHSPETQLLRAADAVFAAAVTSCTACPTPASSANSCTALTLSLGCRTVLTLLCRNYCCCSDELYPVPYASIDWNAARSQIAKEDLYYPHPMIQVRVCLYL